MLFVKLLDPAARAPEVAHPGEDLGYDLFSLEPATIPARSHLRIRTGIAAEARHPQTQEPLGLLVRDRSSMASKGIISTGGVIDAGYRGEIQILLANLTDQPFAINSGDKIAQMLPIPILTGPITTVEELSESGRAEKGFGSSGK